MAAAAAVLSDPSSRIDDQSLIVANEQRVEERRRLSEHRASYERMRALGQLRSPGGAKAGKHVVRWQQNTVYLVFIK